MYVRIGRLHSLIGRDVFKLLLLGLLLMIINYLGIFSKTCLSLLCTIPASIVLFISKVMCSIGSSRVNSKCSFFRQLFPSLFPTKVLSCSTVPIIQILYYNSSHLDLTNNDGIIYW